MSRFMRPNPKLWNAPFPSKDADFFSAFLTNPNPIYSTIKPTGSTQEEGSHKHTTEPQRPKNSYVNLQNNIFLTHNSSQSQNPFFKSPSKPNNPKPYQSLIQHRTNTTHTPQTNPATNSHTHTESNTYDRIGQPHLNSNRNENKEKSSKVASFFYFSESFRFRTVCRSS